VDDGLKQRIVGAFVLVAIGVVFIPVVFDRERIEVLNRKTQIPPAPHIEPISIPAPIQPIAIEKLSPPPTAYIPNDRSIQPDTIETKVLDDKGTPNGWLLQLASYRFSEHATVKRDELIELGYSAYVRSVQTEQGKMTRLFVGPNLDKQKVVEIQKQLNSRLGVDSILLRFEP